MNLVPVIVSIILASAMLGYGVASAQSTTGSSSGTPTTATHPYTPICGDHQCAPGEVYTPGGTAAANVTVSTSSAGKTNATIPEQVKISTNATVTKTNGTMANATGMMQTGMGMSANVTATKNAGNMTSTETAGNVTATSGTPATTVESPAKQVASGTTPADVKCPSGYQLVLNKYDQRPACVTSDVLAKLVARGWASS